jgi:hypothetical protein
VTNTPEQDAGHALPTAAELQQLVEHLYPEPGVVDILTLEQFKYRYRLSGLGATAVADMERAQRITRDTGDHEQIGLAEFHIGLIYLHWGQPHGAIPYFIDAQRHWTFARRRSAACLAQFAQGVAQQHAYQYEAALSSYGKAGRLLSRIEVNAPPPATAFREAFRPCLARCRQGLVEKIRAFGEGEPAAFHLPPREPEPPIGERPTRHIPETDAVRTTDGRPAAPLPQINMGVRRETPTPPDSPPPNDTPPDDEPPSEPVPANGSPVSPIPGHPNGSAHLRWYGVVDRQDLEEFLPAIQAESMLLVDTRTDRYVCLPGDLVIVDQEEREGSIQVESQQPSPQSPRRRIYLAEVDERLSFTRSEAGDIRFAPDKAEEIGKIKLTPNQNDFPIYAEDIIGIVIGIWSNLQRIMEDSSNG